MTQKHTHKYRRHTYKTGNSVYFCTLPDCHHKLEVALSLGKSCICNICGNEFIMNEYSIKLAKPHCDSCGKIKVRAPDGKNHFIRKDSIPVMASLAMESSEDLRTRLDAVVGSDTEEDI